MRRTNMFVVEKNSLKKYLESSPENNICVVAYHQNKPIGCAFVSYTNHSGYYLYGGSEQNSKINGAIKLMHWEIIKHLRKKNIPKYVLGGARLENIQGTKYEGIQKFKLGFGSQITHGYLWKKDIKKLKCFLYDSLFKIKYNVVKKFS